MYRVLVVPGCNVIAPADNRCLRRLVNYYFSLHRVKSSTTKEQRLRQLAARDAGAGTQGCHLLRPIVAEVDV